MEYISTRGQAPRLSFDDVVLTGLARDGGLYVPARWPELSANEIEALAGLPYPELAARVMAPFVAGSLLEDEFEELCRQAYARFDHAAVAPLRQLDSRLWLMELFHGPTLAFKDIALQLLGLLFERILEARDEQVTIVGATSGDTGSAAIEACRGRERITIFMLHPKGRVSEVQRRQMTGVAEPNVHNLAIAGSFDDCQDLVKALFNDQPFRNRLNLSAVNSINWARVMAQIVYYFAAATALGAPGRAVSFAVPSGNFGNVYAGYGAALMGLPIERLIVGSNRNDILTRFFESGAMAMETVVPTLSPSMDIQVSSNFERLLFDLLERDGTAVDEIMTAFRRERRFQVTPAQHAAARERFAAYRRDDEETLREIGKVLRESGTLLDPHSAVGVAAARAKGPDHGPVVALATAHPAKFPDAVEKASGIRPALPPKLGDLYEREEHFITLPNDLAAVRRAILDHTRLEGAA